MTAADLFLAAFLGCLLALAVVAVSVWQVAEWKARRFMRRNAGDIAGWFEGAADGDPAMRAELDKIAQRRTRRQAIARSQQGQQGQPKCNCAPPPAIVCGECKQEQISLSSFFSDGARVAIDAGWRVHAPSGQLHCPACVEKNVSAVVQGGAA